MFSPINPEMNSAYLRIQVGPPTHQQQSNLPECPSSQGFTSDYMRPQKGSIPFVLNTQQPSPFRVIPEDSNNPIVQTSLIIDRIRHKLTISNYTNDLGGDHVQANLSSKRKKISKECGFCMTKVTYQWHRGPGSLFLCNICVDKFKKSQKGVHTGNINHILN